MGLWDAIDEYSRDGNSDLCLKDPPPISDYCLGYRDVIIEVDDSFIRGQFDLPVIEGEVSEGD